MKAIVKIKEAMNNEDGAVMMAAMLFMMVMLMIGTLITISIMTNLSKQKADQNESEILMTIDSAVGNAVALANNPLPSDNIANHIGVENAVFGTSDAGNDNQDDGLSKWSWYAEETFDSVTGKGYNIVATAYNDSTTTPVSRELTIKLQPLPVSEARYLNDGSIGYTPIPTGNFIWGLFGANGVTVNDGAVVRSFDSSVTQHPTSVSNDTQLGTVASNGNITLGGTSPVMIQRMIALQAGVDNNTSGRCVATVACDDKMIPYSFGIDTAGVSSIVMDNCPLPALSYPDWKSSLNGNRINPSIQGNCFNNVIFDDDTEVATGYSASHPVEMFIKGDVTVNAGVKVNQSDLRGGPLALRVYSSDGVKAEFILGTPSDKTMVTGLIAGYKMSCFDTGDSEKSLVITGALACNTVTFDKGTTFWWDSNTLNALEGDDSFRRGIVWTPIKAG